MRRPTQVLPGLPPAVEVILGKALVTDRAHRPDESARSRRRCTTWRLPTRFLRRRPTNRISTTARTSRSMSRCRCSARPGRSPRRAISPAPPARGSRALQVANSGARSLRHGGRSRRPSRRSTSTIPTARLADLKARLEADPRPRYVVIKDGMDHGPFNAVELLQQIGSHAFVARSHPARHVFERRAAHRRVGRVRLVRRALASSTARSSPRRRRSSRWSSPRPRATAPRRCIGVGALALILGGARGSGTSRSAARATTPSRSPASDGINVESAGGLKGARQEGRRARRHGPGRHPHSCRAG